MISKRKEIMNECPEEFEDSLKDYIDEIEGAMADILKLLEIECVSDIGNIELAVDKCRDMASDLY